MSYLSNLYWKLSGYRGERAQLEAQLRTQRKRKADLEGLINNLTRVCDDNYSGVNQYANYILGTLSDILKGTGSVGTVMETISAGLERGSWEDGRVAEALGELRDELNRVNTEIANLEGNLANVNSQIDSTNGAIRYEERRIAEEERRAEEQRRQAEEERRKSEAAKKYAGN